MPFLHVLILAVVQGITEFLPISSSGHLVLAWQAFDIAGWEVAEDTEAERLILDVAVHLGTLFAVVVYFRKDMVDMVLGGLRLIGGRSDDPGGRLAVLVVLATLPLVLAGWLFKDGITDNLRDPTVVALATLFFGLVLFLGDQIGLTIRRIEHLNVTMACLIGLSQVLALIPGTSRSGITMTAARLMGFERTEAARFSMLLAVPAILGAATLAGLDLYRLGNLAIGLDALVAAVIAFATALVAIAAMMRWLRRASFSPFVVYRIVLGLALLYLIHEADLRSAIGF